MADINEILIKVDVDTEEVANKLAEATIQVEELKKQQKELNSNYKDGKISAKEYAVALAENKKQLEAAQRAVKSHTAILQTETKTVDTANMSLDEQRQTLNTLQKAYASLSGEQRKLADQSGGLRDQIKELSQSVIDQEKAIGSAGRNVGFYAESLKGIGSASNDAKDLLEGFGGGANIASKAVDTLGKVSKAFASGNPLMIVLALIVPLLVKMKDSLQENKQALAGVQNMATSFNGVLEKMRPFLDMLIGKIVDGLLVAIDWVMARLKGMFEWLDKIGKKFGKDWGFAKAFEEGKEIAHEMTKEEKAAQEAARKRYEERKKQWVAEREAEEARLKLLEESHEVLDKLAKKHEEEAKKAKEWWDTYNQALSEQEASFAEKQEAALRKWGLLLEDEYLKELKDLAADHANKLLSEEEFLEARERLREKYEKKQAEKLEKETKRQQDAFKSIYKSGADTFNALGQLIGEFGDNSEAASKAQKGFALAAIIANEASAIASGVAATSEAIKGAMTAAAATGIAAPFTAPAFIAEMVGIVSTQLATAIGGIVSAKQVLAGGKFEQGGIVPGSSLHGDNVHVMANSQEMILTREQQSRLFQIANSPMQSSYEATVSAMSAALRNMKAPVMVYQEFQDFQSRTATFNELSRV